VTRTHVLIGALVVFLLGCPLAVFGGFFVLGAAMFSFGDREPELLESDVAFYVGTSFPSSAHDFNGYQEGFQDGYFLARVEMAPADAAAFVAASRFASEPPDSSTNPFASPVHSMPAWWDAHRATTFTAYARSVPGANETLLLDTSDPAKTVVSWNRTEF
jgi:hypothetical protein